MKSFLPASLLLLLVFVACNSTAPRLSGRAATENVQQVVFGRYCGFCNNRCATMYQLDLAGEKVFMDTTDSYRKDNVGRSLIFPSTPESEARYRQALEVVSRIPDSLYAAKDGERFGCPDCADGCGIYFEIRTAAYRKSFYIDYMTDQLEGSMKPFGEYLKKKLADLETHR